MNEVFGKRISISASQGNHATFSGSEIAYICELLQKERIVVWHGICCFGLVQRATTESQRFRGISPSRAWLSGVDVLSFSLTNKALIVKGSFGQSAG
jgi:hypothetical protein